MMFANVNEGQDIRSLFILGFLSIFIGTWAYAIPPEGAEMALLDKGHAKGHRLYANVGYVNPVWSSDYETIQTYVSSMNSYRNVFTYGALLTAGNAFGDRDGYFLRYDQTFYGQSLSFKLAHLDYRYIEAGKNTVSLDYNVIFRIGKKSQFYFSGGLYYRFSLNAWDSQTWNPINFNTEDKEYYLEICFGNKIVFSPSFYMTVDMNNRDPFVAYNGDNVAFDATLNLTGGKKITWRLTGSSRFTGLLAGNGDLGEQTALLGIVSEF